MTGKNEVHGWKMLDVASSESSTSAHVVMDIADGHSSARNAVRGQDTDRRDSETSEERTKEQSASLFVRPMSEPQS